MDGSMYVAAFIVDRLAGKYIDLVAGEKKNTGSARCSKVAQSV